MPSIHTRRLPSPMDTKLKRLNKTRRSVLKKLTGGIGSSNATKQTVPIYKSTIKRVLISRPNHRLGNQLLITPLVQEIVNTFPSCKIDLFVKGNVASIIFENYDNIDRIIKLPRKHFKQLIKYIGGWLKLKQRHYDLVVNVVGFSSSGRLSTRFSRATYKFYGDDKPELQATYADYQQIAKRPVYNFRHYLSELGIPEGAKPMPLMSLHLSESELAKGNLLLEKLVPRKEAKTICLYTFATGAKCYSESWWTDFLDRLKSTYPDYNILEVLPVENVSKINFTEPSYYSRDIREMGAVIANTSIFITADCGVMHMASASGTPTIGFFSVTTLEVYEPYNPGSKGLNTENLTLNEIFNEIHHILDK